MKVNIHNPNPPSNPSVIKETIREVREVSAKVDPYNRVKGYLIDNDGFVTQEVLLNENSPIPDNCVTAFLPQIFKKPKWDREKGKWFEGYQWGITKKVKSWLDL